jgi:hypothetical protein
MTELIRLIFIGLIAHMDLQNSNTAVMVNVNGHEARMRIFHSDGTVDAPVDLTSTVVTIRSGLGSSVPNRTLTNGMVPQLGDITEGKCGVRQEITDHKPDGSVSAYIDYLGGILSPWAFQENKIHFDHGKTWSQPHCAACGTVLNLEVNSGSHIEILTADVNDPADKTKQHSYSVSETDVVVFRNAPPPGSTSTGVSHFPHFYELLDSSCSTTDDVKQALQVGGPHSGEPIACIGTTRCNDLAPLTRSIKTKKRTLSANKIDWSRFNEKEFVAFIVTPDVECTNSRFP